MFLQTIALDNYKNCGNKLIHFSDKLNCIVGPNGVGKTNLLDAIYYTSYCKSYFSLSDASCIKSGSDYFVIDAEFDLNTIHTKVLVSYSPEKGKHIRVDGKKYNRLADHIGNFPTIMITPSDSSLVDGGGTERRRFLDMFISQFDTAYLHALIKYNRLLEQRNKLLKEHNAFQFLETIELFNMQLEPNANYIYKKRTEVLNDILPSFNAYYNQISQGKELVDVEYVPSVDYSNYCEVLNEQLRKDIVLKHTSVGIHRDDLKLIINGQPLRQAGSQGQKKSFLLALTFAKYQYTYSVTKVKPLLLLDDLFDKLDKLRMYQIIEIVSGDSFGQIFITDTDKIGVQEVLQRFKDNSFILSM